MRIAIRSDAATLPQLALIFSQITNVPLQIDWASFDLVGVSVDQPLKISGKMRPVGQWIEAVVAMWGGRGQDRGNHVGDIAC